MTIRHHKRQARLRAAANGTTHQAELNAIARENGHAAWGDFQASLTACASDAEEFMRREEGGRIDELVDAFEAARGAGGHLVVLRPSRDEEASAILMLKEAIADPTRSARLAGIAFAEDLTADALAGAAARGQTLVSASGTMERTTQRGHFIVHRADEVLSYGRSLASRRDWETIISTTMPHMLPRTREEAERMIRGEVGRTTIVRAPMSRRHPIHDTVFHSVDDGMAISLDWNLPEDRRDADWRRLGFVPSFNVLGPKFLPERGAARDAHVRRIANILIPNDDGWRLRAGRDYFEEKAHHLLFGMILMEIDRAEDQGRTPSMPSLIDWIRDGLVTSSAINDERREQAAHLGRMHVDDALTEWFMALVVECMERGYDERCAAELLPLVSMSSNERSGLLGTMDKGLLPFKSARVREMTS